MGTPANFDSLLPDPDLTRKLHNKLYNVRNNNNNVLKLFERCIDYIQVVQPNWW